LSPGQPTKYKSEYCELIVEHMAKGNSLVSFACLIDVSAETVYEWARVHPEFSEAFKKAKDKCQRYFENMGLHGMTQNKDFKPAMWIFWMKARFGWREDNSDENTKTPINVTFNVVDNNADKSNGAAEQVPDVKK
jgi:hypothetical protein